MWAQATDRMHALLFLLMHFTAGGPPRGEEYRSYLIRNTKHSDRTFYWSGGTIMTFQSDALPSHRGETHLRVSQSQVAELRLGSTLPASNSKKG
jgi:hypothetical protein